jgi:hypothetical protein
MLPHELSQCYAPAIESEYRVSLAELRRYSRAQMIILFMWF